MITGGDEGVRRPRGGARHRHQDQGADGARYWHRYPLRRLSCLSHQDGPPAWCDAAGGAGDGGGDSLYGWRSGIDRSILMAPICSALISRSPKTPSTERIVERDRSRLCRDGPRTDGAASDAPAEVAHSSPIVSVWHSAGRLGESDEKPFGPTEIAEPIPCSSMTPPHQALLGLPIKLRMVSPSLRQWRRRAATRCGDNCADRRNRNTSSRPGSM
jgi:hypothetical protein